MWPNTIINPVKSKILYGSYFARQAIDKADECLLVEGYTDVVSLHQAGIENVVASGGTSLTQDNPLEKRKNAICFFVFPLLLYKNILVPERNTNTGAQK